MSEFVHRKMDSTRGTTRLQSLGETALHFALRNRLILVQAVHLVQQLGRCVEAGSATGMRCSICGTLVQLRGDVPLRLASLDLPVPVSVQLVEEAVHAARQPGRACREVSLTKLPLCLSVFMGSSCVAVLRWRHGADCADDEQQTE